MSKKLERRYRTEREKRTIKQFFMHRSYRSLYGVCMLTAGAAAASAVDDDVIVEVIRKANSFKCQTQDNNNKFYK